MAIKLIGSGGSIKLTGLGEGSIKMISNGGGGGGGGPLDPASLADLDAHYLSSDYVAYGTLPEDQNRTVTIGTSNILVYTASDANFNSQPTIAWGVGQGDSWWTPNTLMLPAYSTARTVYFVGKVANLDTNGTILRYGSNIYGDAYYGFFDILLENGEVKIRSYNNVSGNIEERKSQGQTISADTPFILSYAYTENTNVNANTLYINGVAASGTAGTPGLMYTGGDGGDPVKSRNGIIRLGDFSFPNGPHLTLGEFAIFDVTHSAMTRQGVEAHLATKYGITI